VDFGGRPATRTNSAMSPPRNGNVTTEQWQCHHRAMAMSPPSNGDVTTEQ
jgi:hypothetical protein